MPMNDGFRIESSACAIRIQLASSLSGAPFNYQVLYGAVITGQPVFLCALTFS